MTICMRIMNMWAVVRYEVKAKNGTYKDRNGEEKARWHNMGVCFQSDQGHLSIKIDSLPLNWDGWVSLLFVPKTEDKTIVYHVDGNNLNNKLSNLKWVNKENLINRNIKKTNNPLMKGIVYFKAPFGTNYWLCTAKKDGKQKRITFTMSYEGLQEALNWKSEREKELYYF